MAIRGFTLDGGSDHAVLLLHGLTGAPAEMHPIGRRLHRAGATVHAPLLAGHGRDRDTLLETGWRDWLASAERAFDALAARHRHVHVAGICLGAMLAIVLAARRDPATVAAYGTTFRYDGWAMSRLASVRPLVKFAAALPIVRRIGFAECEPYGLRDDQIRAMVVEAQKRANDGRVDSFPLGAVGQLYRLADHVDVVARRVSSPVLIVHARQDDIAGVGNAWRLRDRLNCEVEMAILHESYHLVHLDREAEHVAALTATFFGLPRAISGKPIVTMA